ncbi:hypothetical protein CYMTET_37274 [Cymbomonas tetramitiformis]|uniref:Reverse transcriptase domain-containing protein n=1 Tax=Cymbomonas tetramitiformis TaxID=36881 RepID=A0AAE0F6E0_9CHLO|nr:hypothetical protein CYMTET_37274 [Cymbomonas tetramitiformis]
MRPFFEDFEFGADHLRRFIKHFERGMVTGTVLVLEGKANENAKPVFYIFEDQSYYKKEHSEINSEPPHMRFTLAATSETATATTRLGRVSHRFGVSAGPTTKEVEDDSSDDAAGSPPRARQQCLQPCAHHQQLEMANERIKELEASKQLEVESFRSYQDLAVAQEESFNRQIKHLEAAKQEAETKLVARAVSAESAADFARMEVEGLQLQRRVYENQLVRYRTLLAKLSESYAFSALDLAGIDSVASMDPPVRMSLEGVTPGAPQSPEVNVLLDVSPTAVNTSPHIPRSPPCSPRVMSDSGMTEFEAYMARMPLGMSAQDERPTFAPAADAPLADSLHAVLAQPIDALDQEAPLDLADTPVVTPRGTLVVITTFVPGEAITTAPTSTHGRMPADTLTSTPTKTDATTGDLFARTEREQPPPGGTTTLLLSAYIMYEFAWLHRGALVAIWAALELLRWLISALFMCAARMLAAWYGHVMSRAAWAHTMEWRGDVRSDRGRMAPVAFHWTFMVMCASWRVLGLHHLAWATWHVVPLRILIVSVGWWWGPHACATALALATVNALTPDLHIAGRSLLPRESMHQMVLVWRYRAAHVCYVALVLGCLVFMAAGGQLRWMHGGWRLLACMLASKPPTWPANAGRILKLCVVLFGALLMAAAATQPSFLGWCRDAVALNSPSDIVGSSWDSQQSSRQWEPGWECAAAEEVLPYTVLDELQPGGKTTVTKDEAAWLDTELNATFGGHPDFTEENWEQMRSIIRRCKDCFANKPQDIQGYHGNATHNTFAIPFKDESKVSYQRPRKNSPGEQEIIDIHCKELLEYGFIEPASQFCKHASNVVVAGKKDHETGLWTQTRFCVDLRGTNRLSLKDNTLPHRPEEMYQKVAKAKFKTTLDATKAFHQIPMATEGGRDKTAFWWGNQLYRYTSMPFGAAGATAAFIRVMDYELRALTHCTVTYVDDIVVYSDTAEQHLKDVETVLRTLGDAGIRLHSGKSTFGASTVDFLGFRIGQNTIGAQEAKCKAIQELPRPEDKTGLRSILGMMNYYKGLVGEPGGPNYSELARPLNDLLKKEVVDIKGAWGKDHDESLQLLKDALCSGRCLRPIDYDRPIFLYTDWSNHGIGAVLGQKDEEGVEHICVAISRSLGKTEKQYASFQGEMLAAVWAVRTLRQYLHGVHFTLVTDHSPLTTLMEKADLQGQHLRWAISLQEFDFSVQYRPGPKNENADVPSRYPLPTTVDETGARLDRGDGEPVEVSVAELYQRSFCDRVCRLLAEDPPLGDVARPETQVANYCKLEATSQLETGPVQRLFDVHHREELEINVGELFDTDYPEPVKDSGRLQREAWKALSTLRPVKGAHGSGTPAEYYQETMEEGTLMAPKKVDTRVIDVDFYREAREEGVTCYEPCGGLCAGLEMLLRNGVKVNAYLYQDISLVSQAVARARCLALRHRYPHLLASNAIKLDQLPPNLEHVTARHLIDAGAQSYERWVMVCGFPCQDLSPAGKLAGLEGKHSKLFYETVRVFSVLQQLQPQKPPGYILENVSPLSHKPGTRIRNEVFPRIIGVVGHPVSFDAAQAGSYAHRLRAYWSNLF